MKLIGVGGYARCGKNTFVEIAKNILTKNNYSVIELAFANKLKSEVQEMLRKSGFELDVLNLSAEEKERVRPLFVFWGCQRRYESEGGLYWVNEVDNQLQDIINDAQSGGMTTERMIALVSDVRFPNEAKWVHEKWGGDVIHLKKWTYQEVRDGLGDSITAKVYDSAPNEEEAKQDPLVEAVADVMTEWQGKGKASAAEASAEVDLQKVVLDALNQTKGFRYATPVIGKLNL